MQNLGYKRPLWENLGAKLKFWAPIISSVGIVQLPASPAFLTHDASAAAAAADDDDDDGVLCVVLLTEADNGLLYILAGALSAAFIIIVIIVVVIIVCCRLHKSAASASGQSPHHPHRLQWYMSVCDKRNYTTSDSGLFPDRRRVQSCSIYAVARLVTRDCTRRVINPLYHCRHSVRDRRHEFNRGTSSSSSSSSSSSYDNVYFTPRYTGNDVYLSQCQLWQ